MYIHISSIALYNGGSRTFCTPYFRKEFMMLRVNFLLLDRKVAAMQMAG
jgi:hypothetical protein